MKRSCIILAAFCFPVLLFSDRAGLDYKTFDSRPSSLGDILVMKLASSPFPHADRSSGYRHEEGYFPNTPHYSDSTTTVFIPRGFSADGPADLVFFFHGWYSSVENAEKGFSLYRQFAESRTNALLVLTETARYAPDSFGGKLEETNGFKRFTNELLSVLAERKIIDTPVPGKIVLAGHSGGYRVISCILDRGGLDENIKELYLFDALFSGMNRFTSWIQRSKGRFVTVYLENGETAANTLSLVSDLEKSGTRVLLAGDDPKKDFYQLLSRVVFLKNTGDHYSLVHSEDQFRRFLTSSANLAHY